MPRHKLEGGRRNRGKVIVAAATTAGLTLATVAGSPGDAVTDETLDVSVQQQHAVEKQERAIPAHLPLTTTLTALDHTAQKPTPKPKTSKTSTVTITWREQVVAEGKRQIGVPYVWGGNSPRQGFDCSGLTRWTYKKAGLELPRVANDQMRAMQRTTNPRPGDLVFFLNSHGYAYHVGIFVGNGNMIAAPRPGLNVRKERIWSKRVVYRTPRSAK